MQKPDLSEAFGPVMSSARSRFPEDLKAKATRAA